MAAHGIAVLVQQKAAVWGEAALDGGEDGFPHLRRQRGEGQARDDERHFSVQSVICQVSIQALGIASHDGETRVDEAGPEMMSECRIALDA